MSQFKILSFIPANGYPVAIDAIEALKELDQFVVTIDLREVRKDVLPQSIDGVIKRFKPNFIFTTNSVGLIPGLFDELKIPYASWWTIDPANLKPRPSPFYSIFIIDKTRLAELKEEGYENVYYLPFGANPERFISFPLTDEDIQKYGCDVSFAGACNFSMGYLENKEYFDRLFGGEEVVNSLIDDQIRNPTRPIKESYEGITGKTASAELLVDLRRIEYEAMRLYRIDMVRSLNGFGVNVYGDDGWKETVGSGIQYGGYLGGEEMAKLYNASKINLSIQIGTMKGSLNKRTFDIPAAGGFVLGSFRQALLWHFEEGKEVVYFKEKEELKELISYYLDHQDERAAIAQRAQRRILAEHTYRHRMVELLSALQHLIR